MAWECIDRQRHADVGMHVQVVGARCPSSVVGTAGTCVGTGEV